jgi:rubredoxin
MSEDGIAHFECPLCRKLFDHSDIRYLQGDHIWPYSLCGETSWTNYQLICGSCNAAKSDFIDNEIRRLLGAGEFRSIVRGYLTEAIAHGHLQECSVLTSLLGR